MSFKNTAFFVVFAIFSFFLFPLFSFAQTTDPSTSSGQATLIQQLQKQVEELTKQIQALKQQIGTVQSELGAPNQSIPTPAASGVGVGALTESIEAEPESAPLLPDFTRNLSRGTSGDDVRKLQEFLAKDKEIYPDGLITGYFGPKTEAALKRWQEKHGIESAGSLGPKTIAKFKELGKGVIQGLLESGAGASGNIPPGLQTAPGIQKKLEIATTTTPTTATTTVATTTPIKLPPTPGTCAASVSYCYNSDICSQNGWYWCRSSCYSTKEACLGETYVAPAVPAVPAQPIGQTGVTTVSATPAVPATVATTTTPGGDNTPPSTPTGLTATPAASSFLLYNLSQVKIALTWSKSTDNVGVAGYKIYRNGTQIYSEATSTPLSTLSFTDSGLTPSTAYSYTVAAYDAAGNVSAQSSAVSATAPAIYITNTTSAVNGACQVETSHTGNYGSPDISTGAVSFSAPDVGTGYAKLAKPGISTIDGLRSACTQSDYNTLLTNYCALNSGPVWKVVVTYLSNGNWDSISTLVPFVFDTVSCPGVIPVVQGFTASFSGTYVNLSWQDVTSSTYNLAGPSSNMFGSYNIYRGSSADFIPSNPTNLIAQTHTLSYVDPNLVAGTYYYKIALQDKNGVVGSASSAVSAVIAPASSTTCPDLTFSFTGNKNTYVIGESGWVNYTCSSVISVHAEIAKPDGTYLRNLGGHTATSGIDGFSTSSLAPGNYIARLCYGVSDFFAPATSCQSVAASLPFTVVSSSAMTPLYYSNLAQILESLKSLVSALQSINQ